MTKCEYAAALHARNCNCAQSVACAFAEECGVSEEVLMKAAEGFGLGCGGMQGMCGALSGAIMVAGFKYADGNIEAPKTKKTTYAVAKQVCEEFYKNCGSIVCEELKGIKSGKVLTTCPKCIDAGVSLAEKILAGGFDNE